MPSTTHEDLTAGLDVPGALENAASAIERCRSLEDAMALACALPQFLRDMARELRSDYVLTGGAK